MDADMLRPATNPTLEYFAPINEVIQNNILYRGCYRVQRLPLVGMLSSVTVLVTCALELLGKYISTKFLKGAPIDGERVQVLQHVLANNLYNLFTFGIFNAMHLWRKNIALTSPVSNTMEEAIQAVSGRDETVEPQEMIKAGHTTFYDQKTAAHIEINFSSPIMMVVVRRHPGRACFRMLVMASKDFEVLKDRVCRDDVFKKSDYEIKDVWAYVWKTPCDLLFIQNWPSQEDWEWSEGTDHRRLSKRWLLHQELTQNVTNAFGFYAACMNAPLEQIRIDRRKQNEMGVPNVCSIHRIRVPLLGSDYIEIPGIPMDNFRIDNIKTMCVNLKQNYRILAYPYDSDMLIILCGLLDKDNTPQLMKLSIFASMLRDNEDLFRLFQENAAQISETDTTQKDLTQWRDFLVQKYALK